MAKIVRDFKSPANQVDPGTLNCLMSAYSTLIIRSWKTGGFVAATVLLCISLFAELISVSHLGFESVPELS